MDNPRRRPYTKFFSRLVTKVSRDSKDEVTDDMTTFKLQTSLVLGGHPNHYNSSAVIY